ncbi:hypothetical protein J1N35_017072 [Gossypium stocksii]|uniref:Uncharacterized protein n=1 Tax=Gossypium stocksii TaxID=47602 RepID=A0A9D4A5S9_9ROSI|nr:hypothetical protein J1N35_017072 [Gossypium stocksii]
MDLEYNGQLRTLSFSRGQIRMVERAGKIEMYLNSNDRLEFLGIVQPKVQLILRWVFGAFCRSFIIFWSAIECGKELEFIKRVTGFQLGRLPERYLRVSLVTRKLTAKECAPLIEKITARTNSWSSEKLSYAGILQLIEIVIYNIQAYWCRQVLLPKGVLKKISQIRSRYFGARVNWHKICSPKAQGELGLKKLEDWNKA